MSESDAMRWNDATRISVLAGLVTALGARPVVAAEPARCALTVVDADATVAERWPGLPAQIRATFALRDDIDACARIQLATSGPAIVLRVALPDGRTAVRSVLRREDVMPAVEALLLLPEAGPSTTTETSGQVASSRSDGIVPAVRAETAISRRISEPPPASPAAVATGVQVDFAVAVAARAGDGHMGVGLGLASFLELAHWLLGFQGQLALYWPVGAADRQQPMAGAARAVALELGLLGGRRFRSRAGTLDLAVGPALALHGTATSATQQVGTAAPAPHPGADGVFPRVVVSSRLSFGRRSAVRTFVQADGEIGETGGSSDPTTGAVRLPAWTIGLAVGAVLGAP
jgi:hypothetical protein